jgi:hypothetical protein
VQAAVLEGFAKEQEAQRDQPTIEPPSAGAEHQIEDLDQGR